MFYDRQYKAMEISDLLRKGNETGWNDYELFELIVLICAKPTMFGCSSFSMVASFIEGYVFSKKDLTLELRESTNWLSVELSFPNNWAWFSGLEKKFPNDEDAMRELPKLFDEFRKTKD
jgi:hypothetical protein